MLVAPTHANPPPPAPTTPPPCHISLVAVAVSPFPDVPSFGDVNGSGHVPSNVRTRTCVCVLLPPATTVTVSVPAGSVASASIVFAWYFPERDHMGVDIGNFYSNM